MNETAQLHNPWSTSTAAVADPPVAEKASPKMTFDSVPVTDPSAVFEEIRFRSAEPKFESQTDVEYQSKAPKRQAMKNGKPVWSLKLAAVMRPSGNYPEREGDIKVSWASELEPLAVFERYGFVNLVGARFGVMPVKRKGNVDSYAVYWMAEDVRPAVPKIKAAS